MAADTAVADSLLRLARADGDQDSLAWCVLEECVAQSGADAAAFVYLKDQRDSVCLAFWRSHPSVPAPCAQEPQAMGAWSRLRDTEERFRPGLAAWDRVSSGRVSLPIASAGPTLAVLRLYRFGGGGADLREPSADLLALAGRLLELELNRQRLGRENRALRALASSTASVSPRLDEQTLAERTLSLAMELGGFGRGILLLEENGSLVLKASQGVEPLPLAALQSCPLDPVRSPRLAGLAESESLSLQLLLGHPGLGPCFHSALRRFRTQPLVSEGELLGLLLLGDSEEGRAFDETLFDALGFLLSDQAAASLRSSRLFAELDASRRSLEETTVHLAQAERLAAVGRLAAAVAHQVRNPLSVIGATTELMAERLGPDHPMGPELALLASKVSATDAIVRELMQLGLPLNPSMKRAGIDGLLRNVAGFVKAKADAQGVTVSVRSQSLPELPWIDANLLERCLLDLVLNALQSANKGGAVEIGCAPLESWVELWVADNGPGLGELDSVQLFEPFVSGRPGGTGLGLYNVKRVCEAMGAKVRAAGGPSGRGARFSILLSTQRDPF